MTSVMISNENYEYFKTKYNNFNNIKYKKRYINMFKNIYDNKHYIIKEEYKETQEDQMQLTNLIENFKNVNIYLSREMIKIYSILGLKHYYKVKKYNKYVNKNIQIKDVMKTKQKYDWAKYYLISVLGLINPVDL